MANEIKNVEDAAKAIVELTDTLNANTREDLEKHRDFDERISAIVGQLRKLELSGLPDEEWINALVDHLGDNRNMLHSTIESLARAACKKDVEELRRIVSDIEIPDLDEIKAKLIEIDAALSLKKNPPAPFPVNLAVDAKHREMLTNFCP